MDHCGYIVEVKQLRKHTNADRLQIATFFGNDTCVGLDTKIGDLGIYFPCDLQLSEEFCDLNHLCRKDAEGNPDSGYLERDKRNVKAIKLRGEKSDGIFLPASCLNHDIYNNYQLVVGQKVDIINGHEICKKYIPLRTQASYKSNQHKAKKSYPKDPIAPLFFEHEDTAQLAYSYAFNVNDQIEITLKMHGTSQRTGYLPVLKGYKKTLVDKLTGKSGKPIYEYDYISGTRKCVLSSWEGGFYGSNLFRKQHADFFTGKLWKGETVYYEVVGFTDSGSPIMGSVKNSKVKDKEFLAKYGEVTEFSYGCSREGFKDSKVEAENITTPQSDFYVYRMTMTNEDGDVVEYTPDFMRYRCEQIGCKTVPVFWKGYIPEYFTEPTDQDKLTNFDAGSYVKHLAEQFYDGPDPIGKSHIREGVVVRIVNKPRFTAYKHKNIYFKILEGIVKDEALEPDMEEAQEIENV